MKLESNNYFLNKNKLKVKILSFVLSLGISLSVFAESKIDNKEIKQEIKKYLKDNTNIRNIDYLLKKFTFSINKFYLDLERLEYIEGDILNNDNFYSKIKDFISFKENYPLIYNFYEKYFYQSENKIFIFKSKKLNNKFVLLFYNKNDLKLASYVSPGLNKNGYRTPKRKFYITGKKHYRVSRKFNNAPMPLALYLGAGGYFIHVGKVDGYPKSHGCIRIPRVSGYVLFKSLDVKKLTIPVVFMGYDKSF